MNQESSFQMGSDLAAKHVSAILSLLYAADESDFYLRQNQCVAIVIPEMGEQLSQNILKEVME